MRTVKQICLEIAAEHENQSCDYHQLARCVIRTWAAESGNDLHNVSLPIQREVLDEIQDLFRHGYLSTGHNFDNVGLPFIHIANQGLRIVDQFSIDPANPRGYMQRLNSLVVLDPIVESYVIESVDTFNSGHYKSSAVMIGCAAERATVMLRDHILQLPTPRATVPTDMRNNKMGEIRRNLKCYFDNIDTSTLGENYSVFWGPIGEMIRLTRNNTGHPSSVNPVSREVAHANLLQFPVYAELLSGLQSLA